MCARGLTNNTIYNQNRTYFKAKIPFRHKTAMVYSMARNRIREGNGILPADFECMFPVS